MISLLSNGAFIPTATSIGFLRSEVHFAVDVFLNWMNGIYEPLGVKLSSRRISGPLSSSLAHLLPLTNIKEQRFLMMPTQGSWLAYFANGYPNPEIYAPISTLAEKLGTDGLLVTYRHEGEKLGFPATIFELYGPEPNPILNTTRSIAAVYDGYNWEFHDGGQPQPFEETERYREKRIADRFTGEMLARYAAALGVRCFDEDFYLPDQAVLIEKIGPTPAGMKSFPSFLGSPAK